MTDEADLQKRFDRAEVLFAQWAGRVEAEKPAPFEELLAAHSELASELRRLHTDWKLFAPLLGKVLPGLIASDASLSIAPLTKSEEEDLDLPSQELLDRLSIEVPNSGRYKFRAVIGRGGGGVVLKVWDSKLHRPLAMKLVLGKGEDRPKGVTPGIDSRTLTRFVDEARVASQLSHPGIVPVHELGADESGRAFFTMKLVKGENFAVILDHVRTGHNGWNETRAVNVLLRVCEAMAFAHEKRVVHRDLKPANLMVGRHGEVYVMDWGLARVLGETDHRDLRLLSVPRHSASAVDSMRRGERDAAPDSPLVTMDGAVVGTPAYMAPEQARGELDQMGPLVDVYAMGAMLYELISGQPPFVPAGARLSPHTILARVLEGPPHPLAELAQRAPLELTAICEKAMQREATKRYPDMRALAADLQAYLERRVVFAYERGTWAETRKWLSRNRSLAISCAGALFFLVTALVFALSLKSESDKYAALMSSQLTESERETRIANEALQVVIDLSSEGRNATIARLMANAPSDEIKGSFLWLLDRTDPEGAVQIIRGLMSERQPLRVQAAQILGLLHSAQALALKEEWLVCELDYEVRSALQPQNNIAWSPLQASGPPDVEDPMSDDVRAWAPVGTQVGLQTLTLDYDPPTHCSEVRVHQVHRPGAIVSIHAIEPNGTQHLLPQGSSLPPGGFLYVSTMPTTAYPVKRLVVTLDTDSVDGYNEIDAVEIVGPGGLSWAVAASASSYFGQAGGR